MSGTLATLHYDDKKNQACWQGFALLDGDDLNTFMTENVASRLLDLEGTTEFETHLRGLAITGFAQNSLNDILAAEIPEERDWAVGEALAEAWLSYTDRVIWPWNMERDKRTPKASLPGADLVGFHLVDTNVRLLLGEVKTSCEKKYPPQVMYGRSGMTYQIDKLVTDLGLIYTLLKWLLPRCKNTGFEVLFNMAVSAYLESGNQAVSVFGLLIRDTIPNELDLIAHGKKLGKLVKAPTTCNLIALYLPCKIADLPDKVNGGKAS